jgi:nucleoside-diphosphate-sugar epimerase
MIFIKGGNGFLGQGFVSYCQKNNLKYKIITRENYEEFIGKECDILVNANGNSKKFLANEDPKYEFDATVKSVVRSLHDIKYRKYIMCSTCDVYNDFENYEASKETIKINMKTQSRYGFHKYTAEQFVRYEANEYLIFRFGGFVGEGLKKNAIYDILNGGPLWLDPQSQLQFIDKMEAVKSVFNILNSGIKNEIINICGNGLVKLQNIINLTPYDIKVKENSPKVIYNINIDKLLSYVSISSSEEVVKNYIERGLK